MNKKALGLIEVVGMVAAIEVADTCVKSSNVQLIDYELTKGSGLVTIKIQGDIGAVKSAIEAAKSSVSIIGKVFSTLVIPRPSDGVNLIINSQNKSDNKKSAEEIKENNTEKYCNGIKAKELKEDIEQMKKEIKTTKEIEIRDKEKIEIEHKEEFLTEDKSEICNICKDKKCTRKKGQPKNMCVHYKRKNNKGDN